MTLRYLSVCSGIEAAAVAWQPYGFEPVAFAEIEPFPCAVLTHHYPNVPNWGDITRYKEWPDAQFDLLAGGTPCQSFSVAGMRGGLDDPRGNLLFSYLGIAARYRPRWLVWENVPGCLSTNGGRDFGTLIGALEALGYNAAWRVLDAQYCRVDGFGRAVPQRRRRVFVVGHSHSWRSAAAVLFEPESLQGHPPPRRQAGQGHTRDVASGTGTSGRGFSRAGGTRGQDLLVAEVANTLTRRMHKGVNTTMDEGQTMVPVAIQERAVAENPDSGPDGVGIRQDGASYTLEARGTPGQGYSAIAFKASHYTRNKDGKPSDVAPPLSADADKGGQDTLVAHNWQVRRLMPVECERLMGYPDGYTAITYRGKAAADSPRYKALGNSMAVNVMRWIGRRISIVDNI